MNSGQHLRRYMTSATAILVGGIVSAALIGPSPAAAADLPDLQVTIAVTPAKATYAVGDAVTTTFTIKNVGGATAVNARIEGGDEDGLDRRTDPPSAHQDLAPGQSFSIDWAGTIDQSASVAGRASGSWAATNDAGEANPGDNTGRFNIAVPGVTGVLHVKVYVDINGQSDDTQPGLVGATIVIQDDGRTKTVATVTTGAGGYFSATLPAGDYWLTAPGWKLKGSEYAGHVQVKGGRTSEATLPLVAGSNSGGGTQTTAPADPIPAASSSSPAAPGGTGGGESALPVTGVGAGPAILAGAAAILVGAAVVFVARRRRNRFVLPK
ncbi:LPXTG cell wall anchor domain-containing protein [Amorphoplanes digitatis]|uniref:LPXTG-motif cell wall-anchored protein n=1 Tax=Actinoplanes digitatis TaxID=1868 RepID=A0A7W7MT45_9ACTN|nr:LPXTG cell wall anchor domain-containing protein [Actinoplanes digitatis]MBB4765214.1 LPXTG-motif cell wall-anchored protein [Actinoplanes digitatis]GID94665.1 hypothetical protein Adi01nite_40770 [Actinoplanes digitatis]